jgi:formate dehydrogenase beta subunit
MTDAPAPTRGIPTAEARSVERRVKAAAPKGRVPEARARTEIEALLGEGEHPRNLLIEALHRIQDRYGHLSAAHLVALAAVMKLSPVEVFEVATFYHHFDVVRDGEPAPRALTVRVCASLSCELAGARQLRGELAGREDVRVMQVPCVGRCHGAPVAVVGQNAIEHADAAAVATAVKGGVVNATSPAHLDYRGYRAGGGYATLVACAEGALSDEAVLQAMEHSGLRGLGGAGFPAGRKWRIVRAEPAPRLLAVNIDEGEPGTFKDRWWLERDPHRFVEGMLIAARVVGIAEIYVYLRDEYAGCRDMLARELAALAADPPCELPVIHLRRGAGAYVCGEESAMIESIEGKRGMPRLRPPYVAQVGLFGRPTLEHNMETLYWVRDIVERGAAWFAGHGRRGRQGLRSFSVSGRVARPGVHLAPAGISARELIDEFCGGMQPGHLLYAYLPGGASGGILPASMADLPLDFDTLAEHGCFVGSGALIVLSQHDRARDAATNAMAFFAEESCGQCTPCRVGTEKAVSMMHEPVWNQSLLEDLSRAMADASICGLGQAAPNPVRCVIRYFPHEIV